MSDDSATAAKAAGRDAPKNASEGKPPTLFAMLRNTHRELKAIDQRRDALHDEVNNLNTASAQATSEYWVNQSKAFEKFVAKGGANIFEQWRARFATNESAEAKKVAQRQAEMRAEIKHLQEEIARLDSEYWAKWQACMDVLSDTPGKKPPPRSPGPSRQPEAQLERRHDQSLATAAASSPQQPTLERHGSSSAAKASPSQQPVVPATPLNTKSPSPPPAATGYLAGRQAQAEQPLPVPAASRWHGVTDAVPGQIYQAYYEHPSSTERGWYMGTPLPWDGSDWAKDINLDFSMSQMDLEDGFPECYAPGITTVEREDGNGNVVPNEIITSLSDWTPGFEDGGPRVRERRFLFLWFDDRKPGKLKIPKAVKPGQKMEFTKSALASMPIDWVSAKNLRHLNVKVDGSVRGRKTADKFTKMMDRLTSPRQNGADEMDYEAEGDVTGLSANTTGFSHESSSAMPELGRGSGTQMMPEAPMVPESQAYDSEQYAAALRGGFTAQHDEEMPDSDASTVGATPVNKRRVQNDRDDFHLSSPADDDDKMDIDVDDDYAGTHIPQRAAAAGGDHADDKFDEGVGMDYDLEELAKLPGQAAAAAPRLPPIQPSSPAAPRLPSLREVFGDGVLAPSRRWSGGYSPTSAWAGRAYSPERLTSADSGWLSQGGATAEGGKMQIGGGFSHQHDVS